MQHEQAFGQTIECDVQHCRFNESSSRCGLESIKVSSCNGPHTGNPEDESMCASYKNR